MRHLQRNRASAVVRELTGARGCRKKNTSAVDLSLDPELTAVWPVNTQKSTRTFIMSGARKSQNFLCEVNCSYVILLPVCP